MECEEHSKMECEEDRLQVIHAWQRYYNMEPRDDSALTRKFVSFEIDCHPSVVARELVATDFLYKHTLYGDFIQDFFRRTAYLLKEEYDISWDSAYKLVREYGTIALKILMVVHCDVTIPERLP